MVLTGLAFLLEVMVGNGIQVGDASARRAVQWTMLAVDVIPVLGLTWLVGLHGYLVVTGKSTLWLIMENRKEKKKKSGKVHPTE
jgi:hypothetical protein